MIKNIIYTFVVLNTILASNFVLSNKSENASKFSFNIGDYSIESVEGFNRIVSNSEGKTEEYGSPELPTFSFNYGIDKNKEYIVEYTVIDYVTYQNIDMYPSQPYKGDSILLIKNDNLYNSKNTYPESNINYQRQSLRGYELLAVSIVPFQYNFESKELTVFTSVDLSINEIGQNTTYRNDSFPRSESFERMYRDMIINDDILLNDNRSFQKPSILYICGGDVATGDYNSFFRPLVEWRRQQGFEVNVASLNQTGTSTTSIKNYISDAYYEWENPPEYVCIVGDTSGSIDVNTYIAEGGSGGWWGSSAQGEGDHPYTMLDGNDILSDIMIGRISVRNTSELNTIVNKILVYEKATYISQIGDEWYQTAALVGDPYDSGISTVITNEYVNSIIDIHGGITDVRTKYSGTGFDSFMRDQINDGISYLNYRGFYGFSNFSQTDVDQLNNGPMLPFLTTLTCDTGSFAEDNSCIVESLLRAGSASTPKGAIATIGTAQPYTHTAFNNIVTIGIYDGIFLDRVETVGEAQLNGKLALHEIYPQNPNDNVYLFSVWNSLLGDPSTHLWSGAPVELNVTHSDIFIQGSNNFQVSINDDDGNPVSNAMVTLYKLDGNNIDMQISLYTNNNGIVDFTLNDVSEGEIMVTSRCQNCVPTQTNFEVTNDYSEIILNENSLSIDDSYGQITNNNGLLNPGEIADISFTINNNSNQSFNNLEVTLTSQSQYVDILEGSVSINNLSGNGSFLAEGLKISLLSNTPDLENLQLRVSLNSNNAQWDYNLPMNASSADIILDSVITGDNNNNGILDRGETATLGMNITNLGTMNLENITGQINFSSLMLDLDAVNISFPNLQSGQTSQVIENIEITANNNITNGTIVSIPIEIFSENGYSSEEVLSFQIGQVSVTDPLGPDQYGYYIYDQNDDYELAPEYNWIEIDPGYGGPGEELSGINDNGDNGDDVTTIDLPFNFTFYGIEYDKLSICSNGWIAFGETDMESFRNYTLPGPGGPPAMVAVFWDDLLTTGGGDVYTYYDSSNDSFVVEWSDVRTWYNNTLESFQVILYNTNLQTITGDDEIKLQYKEFNNNSIGSYPVGNYDGPVVHGQYCTIGIENHLSNDGLEYTFNNNYPQAAMPLYDGTALFITTGNPYLYAIPSLDLSDEEFYVNLQSNQQSDISLELINQGEEGSLLIYESKISSFNSPVTEIDDFGYSWTKSSVDSNIDYNWIDIENDNIQLVMTDDDAGSIASFNFNFPFYGNNYNFCAVMANGWLSFGAGNEPSSNQSVFDDDSPRPAIFAFWDDLNPENLASDGQGTIKYNSNNERTVIWYDNVGHGHSFGNNGLFDFQIVLYPNGKISVNYREMSGNTESATIGIVDMNGQFGLESNFNESDFFEQDGVSVLFDTKPAWIEILSNEFGQIPEGQSRLIDLSIDANSLENDNYQSFIMINSNATFDPLAIPVNLTVSNNGLLLGDMNQDEVLDVLDIVRLIQIILGQYMPTNFELILADLNEDDVVNIQDIVLLINTILSN